MAPRAAAGTAGGGRLDLIDDSGRILREIRSLDLVAPGPCADLLQYWQERRAGAALPRRERLDMLVLLGLSGGWHHVLDVRSDDPAEFAYVLAGPWVRVGRFDAASHRVLGDIPCPLVRALEIQDCGAVKRDAAPMLRGVAADCRWGSAHYTSLILPLSGDGRAVDTLIIGHHQPSAAIRMAG